MTLTQNDIVDALTKAAAYDAYHTPKTSNILLLAWKEHFDRYTPTATREELLDAVTQHHRTPHERMLQPADLSWIIRTNRNDTIDRTPTQSPSRRALEARSEAKGTDTPQMTPQQRYDAHRDRLERVLAGLKPGEQGAREFIQKRLRYHANRAQEAT